MKGFKKLFYSHTMCHAHKSDAFPPFLLNPVLFTRLNVCIAIVPNTELEVRPKRFLFIRVCLNSRSSHTRRRRRYSASWFGYFTSSLNSAKNVLWREEDYWEDSEQDASFRQLARVAVPLIATTLLPFFKFPINDDKTHQHSKSTTNIHIVPCTSATNNRQVFVSF